MKKLLSILLLLICGIVLMAQDKTVDINIKSGFNWGTYVSYNATAADTLTANQDTIDFRFQYQGADYINKIAFKVGLDTIAGADTLSISLLGYDFLDDTTPDATIAAATTNLASATDVIKSDDYSAGADEYSFRYYTVRLIRTGVGEGIKVEDLEFKLYTD